MQLRHDVRRLCHGFDDVVGEVPGVWTGEPNALEPFDLPAGTQKLGEGPAIAELHAVGVDVLPEQRDFYDTVGDKSTYFGEDVPRPTILLSTP